MMTQKNENTIEPQRPQPAPNYGGFERRHHSSVEGVVTLLDWLLVAFILALVFQAFAVQAFQIPTGSMAETLRGDHYRMRCVKCGFRFETGSDSLSFDPPLCTNCGQLQPTGSIGAMVNGDRIFVLKCIYQFFEPKRWDVVVFKNPIGPKDNYIKRMIGLPGETVQMIDGDIYINGAIVRKPANVQRELWIPVFQLAYQPSPSAAWRSPFVNSGDSAWAFDPQRPSRFTLDTPDSSTQTHTFYYDSEFDNGFRATYAYNDSATFPSMPQCSDLMIRFHVKGRDSKSAVGAVLEKYGILFSVRVELHGAVIFSKFKDGQWVPLRATLTDGIRPGEFAAFEFANVDRQLVLRWQNKRLTYDLVKDPDLQGIGEQTTVPTVQVFGVGGLEIRNLGIYRDIYYVDYGALRGTLREPFTLGQDEFFVCGDNSPNSLDSRLWAMDGVGNHGVRYRQGIVPREYLMGKAAMVYWSQAFRPRPTMAPLIPNFNTLKVIFGGSDELY